VIVGRRRYCGAMTSGISPTAPAAYDNHVYMVATNSVGPDAGAATTLATA